MTTPNVLETNLEGLAPPKRGKVRDIYDLGDSLLIVATDRISAFDVVLPNAIPGKGRVLTQISKYWFTRTADIVQNHLLSTDIREYPASCRRHADLLEGRSMMVRKAKPLPVECIVRGYLTGSGLKEYRATGAVSGIGAVRSTTRSAASLRAITVMGTSGMALSGPDTLSVGAVNVHRPPSTPGPAR